MRPDLFQVFFTYIKIICLVHIHALQSTEGMQLVGRPVPLRAHSAVALLNVSLMNISRFRFANHFQTVVLQVHERALKPLGCTEERMAENRYQRFVVCCCYNEASAVERMWP